MERPALIHYDQTVEQNRVESALRRKIPSPNRNKSINSAMVCEIESSIVRSTKPSERKKRHAHWNWLTSQSKQLTTCCMEPHESWFMSLRSCFCLSGHHPNPDSSSLHVMMASSSLKKHELSNDLISSISSLLNSIGGPNLHYFGATTSSLFIEFPRFWVVVFS